MRRLPAPMPAALRVLALGTVVAALLACGPSPEAAAKTVPVTSGIGPIAMFDRQMADLGTVMARKQGFEAFLAFNMGDRPLLLGPLTIRAEEGCGASAQVVDDVLYLPPMTGQVVRVAFGQHVSGGAHRYSLGVPSNDPAHPYSRLVVSFNVDDNAQIVASGPLTSSQ